MDLQSTITLVGFAGFAVALFGYLASMKRDLRAEIAASIDALSRRFDSRFETVDSRFDAMDARFDAVESRLGTRIDAVESRLSTRIDAVESRLEALDTRVGDLRDDVRAGFAESNARLSALEQRTFDIGRQRHPGTG